MKVAKCLCGGDYFIIERDGKNFKAQCSNCVEEGITNIISGTTVIKGDDKQDKKDYLREELKTPDVTYLRVLAQLCFIMALMFSLLLVLSFIT